MRRDNGYQTPKDKGWIKKIKRYKHHSSIDDYYSEQINDEKRFEYREEFWEYLEENGYWD